VPCKGRCWYNLLTCGLHILLPFDLFSGRLEYLVVIWYLSPFWYIVPRKIWQPCVCRNPAPPPAFFKKPRVPLPLNTWAPGVRSLSMPLRSSARQLRQWIRTDAPKTLFFSFSRHFLAGRFLQAGERQGGSKRRVKNRSRSFGRELQRQRCKSLQRC
jgi:hypothetical protein